MSEELRLFTIGSSIFITIFPFYYLKDTGKLHELVMFLPIYYGTLFMLLNYIFNDHIHDTQTRYIIIGAIIGLFLSFIGRYYNFPDKLGFTPENEFLVHFYAMIIYAFAFGVIGYQVDRLLK